MPAASSFRFSNLCGTVYRQGNVLFTPDGNSVISPVGNRVSVFDLVKYALSSFGLGIDALGGRLGRASELQRKASGMRPGGAVGAGVASAAASLGHKVAWS